MKLYYATGACSLAGRISLHEAGIAAEFERVDMTAKRTEGGADYAAINPKSYVPMLVLDDGTAITENVAVLDHIAALAPALAPQGPFARTRLIEMLAYLSSEVHVAFKPFFRHADGPDQAAASETIVRRLGLVEPQVRTAYLFGENFTVADAYLFVMLRWAKRFEVPLTPALLGYFDRVVERPALRRALAEEGLA